MHIFSLPKNAKFIIFTRVSGQINARKTLNETKKVINTIKVMPKRPLIPHLKQTSRNLTTPITITIKIADNLAKKQMLQHNRLLGLPLRQGLTHVRFPAIKLNDLNEYVKDHRYEVACAENNQTIETLLPEGNVLVLWAA